MPGLGCWASERLDFSGEFCGKNSHVAFGNSFGLC